MPAGAEPTCLRGIPEGDWPRIPDGAEQRCGWRAMVPEGYGGARTSPPRDRTSPPRNDVGAIAPGWRGTVVCDASSEGCSEPCYAV